MEAKFNSAWNAGLYDSRHQFVYKFGEEVINLLNPKAGERILDLGCGTGPLTQLIADKGAIVKGIDASASMIEQARKNYPDLHFEVIPAEQYHAEGVYDAIFSNATLHWVLKARENVKRMYENLKPGGRVVAEMGGKGNVQDLRSAIEDTLLKHKLIDSSFKPVWYFPSLSEYTSILEEEGFRVLFAAHFDRDTELADAENGVKDWVKMFGSSYFIKIEPAQLEDILDEIQEKARPGMFKDGKWVADYKRLRFSAIKV